MAGYTVPGVYRQDVYVRPAPALPTGVPAFVGLATGAAGPVRLQRKEEFPWRVAGAPVSLLEHAIAGFFDNGGGYCYALAADATAPTAGAGDALIAAFELAGPLGDVDLVAAPDAVVLRQPDASIDVNEALRVQRALIGHCERHKNRIALLDPLGNKTAQALIDDHVKKLGILATGPTDAVLYYPWIRTTTTGGQSVPPSGHVAGIISRTDSETGVFRAPANREIQGAVDLDANLDADAIGLLNGAGVNCLRALPGRGIRVWGARTLSPDAQWRYLNVRRLVLTTLRWIDANLAWAAFEPNVPALWTRIRRELDAYLTRLWRAGALKGDSAAEAFYVKCDAELNPPATRVLGQVVTEIGIAPTMPAEFVVVRIQHRAGTTELI